MTIFNNKCLLPISKTHNIMQDNNSINTSLKHLPNPLM